MSKAEPLPQPRKHPNRVAFRGILTRVDQPSDKSPSGARGHRVVLTRAAAENATWSLEGMAVDYIPSWEGHDARQKIGVIEEAWLEDDALWVSGYLYAHDFSHLLKDVYDPKRPLGMSYEMVNVHIEDMRAEEWRISELTFTGAAILYSDKAAYKNTSFMIDAMSAAEEPFTGRLSFVETGDTTGQFEAEERRTWMRL